MDPQTPTKTPYTSNDSPSSSSPAASDLNYQDTPSRSTQGGTSSGRKAWEEAKSWRRGPIQFGDMAIVERPEPSRAMDESTPKESAERSLNNEYKYDQVGMGSPGKEVKKAVLGTPTKVFVPKGGFVWADEFDEDEEEATSEEEVVKESDDIIAEAGNGKQHQVAEEEEDVAKEAGDIVAEARADDGEEEEEEEKEVGQSDPTPSNVPELVEHMDLSPSVVSEDMPTTPDFEQLPEVDVADVIVPDIPEDFAEVIAGAVAGLEDTVSKDPAQDPIVVGDSEDIAGVETALETQDNLPAEDKEMEENVQAALGHSEGAVGSDDDESGPNTPKQSAEIALDNEDKGEDEDIFGSDDEMPSTPEQRQSTEIPLDNELPALTTPILPAMPAISYARIAAAAAPISPSKAPPMSSEPKKDIQNLNPRTPIKTQPLCVQIQTPTLNVQATPTTLPTPLSPAAPAADLEWEPTPSMVTQQPSEWSTVTPKKHRKSSPVASPAESHNGGSNNGDEEEKEEFVPETPTKAKSKRRRPKSKAVRAAAKVSGAPLVEVPIKSAVGETAIAESENEVVEKKFSHVEDIDEEEGPVADGWSSGKRLFLVMLALWFGYSCIYYLPDFLEWVKEVLASEVPEL